MLNGPHLIPDGAITQLVILLHGFGSNGQDLISLAPYLAEQMPNTAFYAPNAPQQTPFGEGYQWFSDADWTFHDKEGIEKATKLLEGFISEKAKKHKLDEEETILMGFSQGTMTSLYAQPRLSFPVKAVVGFSGRMVFQDEFPEVYPKVPLMLIHGEADDVVPFESSLTAAKIFSDKGYNVKTKVIPFLTHGIDEAAISAAVKFAKKHK